MIIYSYNCTILITKKKARKIIIYLIKIDLFSMLNNYLIIVLLFNFLI